jgi:hypothetical protein
MYVKVIKHESVTVVTDQANAGARLLLVAACKSRSLIDYDIEQYESTIHFLCLFRLYLLC